YRIAGEGAERSEAGEGVPAPTVRFAPPGSAAAFQGRDPEHPSWAIGKAAALHVRVLQGIAEPLVGYAPQGKSLFAVFQLLRAGERRTRIVIYYAGASSLFCRESRVLRVSIRRA